MPEARSDYGSNALSAAMTFAVAVAAFALLGHWLDEKLDSSPWLLVVGCVLGTAGGMLHLIRKLAPETFSRRGERRKPSERGDA
ncbi:MAG: AtpZ/AtpI family protein [Planctomycetota bacterium]